MKVLLVEDQRELANWMQKGLCEEGFACDCFENGSEALASIQDQSYDAIILDIMLPGRDGLSILRCLRESGNTVPVILVTARDRPSERIEGLNTGADDYLIKPFYLDELVARLRAIWRRSSGTGLSVLKVADLTVNLVTREVDRGGRAIDLSPREFALLAYFAQAPGRVRTRTQILDQVWEYQFNPGTNLVDVYVRRLRSKIDLLGEQPLFETIRSVGYRLRSNL